MPGAVEQLLQVRRVLAEAARPVGRGHKKNGALGLESRLLHDAKEIADSHLCRITFLAGSETPAQFQRAIVRGRSRVCLDAKPAKDAGERLHTAFRHRWNVDDLPGERMRQPDLPGYVVVAAEHRRNPLLSR